MQKVRQPILISYPKLGPKGAVTQLTNKSTGVTLDAIVGQITMDAASLGAATSVGFVLTNGKIGVGDVVIVNHGSAGTAGAYQVTVGAVSAGSCRIDVRNITGGALLEAIVLNFAVIKAQ